MTRRKIILGRLVLAGVVFYSLCIPLDHTCLDPSSFAAGSLHSSAHPIFQKAPAPSNAHTENFCLACFWSHNLLFRKTSASLGVPRLISSNAVLPRLLEPARAETFDTALLRGPPYSLPA